MGRERTGLLLLTLIGAAVACGRSGVLPFEDGNPGGHDFPDPEWRDPTGPGTPTATPAPTPEFGDGRDGAVTISGTMVVNTCHVVVFASGVTASLASAVGSIEPGELLLFHQVQDTFATITDTSDVTVAGRAGAHQLVRALAVNGTQVQVDAPLGLFGTSSTRRAQVCTVPQFTTLAIPDGQRLVAVPWDGQVGGILAFVASVTVDLDGELAADGLGFRGGAQSESSLLQNFTGVDSTTAGDAGGKGEGLDIRAYGRLARGNYANGAGGGNAHNAGGGGGGNGGAGGAGGREFEQDGPDADSAGIEGARVMLGDVLAFGGGGGGGHQDADGGLHHGGAGGGVIAILAAKLEGDGDIRSRGLAGAPDTEITDGGGGGGAGGTIRIDVPDTDSFDGTIDVRGAVGGDTESDNGCHGPGGGGGGGVIQWRDDISGADVQLDGGDEGECNGNGYFATAGEQGRVDPLPSP